MAFGTHNRSLGAPACLCFPLQLREECGKLLECPSWVCRTPPSLPLIVFTHVPPVGGLKEHPFFIRAGICQGPCGRPPQNLTSSCAVRQVSTHKTVTRVTHPAKRNPSHGNTIRGGANTPNNLKGKQLRSALTEAVGDESIERDRQKEGSKGVLLSPRKEWGLVGDGAHPPAPPRPAPPVWTCFQVCTAWRQRTDPPDQTKPTQRLGDKF